MICSIPFLELTLVLNAEEFEEQLNSAGTKAEKKGHRMTETDFGCFDEALMSKGVGIAYHDGKYRKKIRFVVNPCLVIGIDDVDEIWAPTSGNISRLITHLKKLVDSYFHSDYGLGDFDLVRVDFAVDIDVESQQRVADYIKVLHNIGRVKCFSPLKPGKRGRITKAECFALKGNSTGVEFRAYGLKHEKKILRAEVRLTTKDIIRAYSDELDTSEQIGDLARKSETIFMDIFQRIVPRGDYYKKPKAEKLIWEKVPDRKMRFKMLRLLALIPEKKSLHLAQKAMDYRKIGRIMAAFAEIEVSPVTISKRQEVKKLRSLYSHLG